MWQISEKGKSTMRKSSKSSVSARVLCEKLWIVPQILTIWMNEWVREKVQGKWLWKLPMIFLLNWANFAVEKSCMMCFSSYIHFYINMWNGIFQMEFHDNFFIDLYDSSHSTLYHLIAKAKYSLQKILWNCFIMTMEK